MKNRSIRIRLTVWYLLSLVLILSCFVAGARIAVAIGVYRAVDQELRAQSGPIEKILRSEASVLPAARLHEELEEMTQGSIVLRVTDESGNLVYQSPHWESPAGLSNASFHDNLTSQTLRTGHYRSRIATERIEAGSTTYMMVAARSLKEVDRALSNFELALLLAAPFAIGLAALGGYWLSARALSPVSRIIAETRAIEPRNLSARLQPSPARDELYDLTQTINAMLGRIERSVQQIQQFTADASHELRAPLTLIRTAADFSLRKPRSQQELTDALRKILRESERMSRLVDSLLLLSRTDAGINEINLASTDLNTVLEQAFEQIKPLALERLITIKKDLPESPLHLFADDDALRRVAFILLDNAVKYTPEGGHISISAGTENDRLWFAVADTGTGIRQEDLSKIFDRFWRADQVRSRGKGGLGLGLSIAQQIIKKHGGQITVTSSPDEGSTFVVHLPVGQKAESLVGENA